MATAEQKLQIMIRKFLDKWDMPAWRLGRLALNDPGFVEGLEKGRSPSLRTVAKLDDFMGSYRE